MFSAGTVPHIRSNLNTSTLASRIRSPAPQVEFRVGDFFALKVAEHQQFDVVYDYTYARLSDFSDRVS